MADSIEILDHPPLPIVVPDESLPKRVRHRIKDLTDLRRSLNRVLRLIELGKLDPKTGGVLIYGFNVLRGVLNDMLSKDYLPQLPDEVLLVEVKRRVGTPSAGVTDRDEGSNG